MVLNLHIDECTDNTQDLLTERKGKEKKQLKETPTSDQKPKKRQRARSLEEEQVSDPLARAKARHIRDKTMLKQRA
jgi:hypothetical protein